MCLVVSAAKRALETDSTSNKEERVNGNNLCGFTRMLPIFEVWLGYSKGVCCNAVQSIFRVVDRVDGVVIVRGRLG